jgi:hypothetical protein
MKAMSFAACILTAASVAAPPLLSADEPQAPPAKEKVTEAEKPPAIPATPAAVADLIYARPFTLEKSFKFFWSKERQNVTTGTLLVLKIDKALVYPRAIATPVLYVGNRTAERLNHGHKSGHVIAIVPGEVDLTKQPIWFGSPDLPERVDATKIKSERALADKAEIKPFSKKKVKAALAKGGERLRVEDVTTLLRDAAAPLIEEYSPQEKNLADDFRRPVITKQKPKEPAGEED